MRMFKKMIFMGNGHYFQAQCYELILALQQGFELLRSIQQEPNKWDQMDVEDIAKDIFVALTGKEVVQTKDVLQ